MLVVGELQPLMDRSPSQDENPATLTFSGDFCTTKISSSALFHFYATCYNGGHPRNFAMAHAEFYNGGNLRNESAPQRRTPPHESNSSVTLWFVSKKSRNLHTITIR